MREIKNNNLGISIIGIIITIVVAGLLSGALYFYLNSQMPRITEIDQEPSEQKEQNKQRESLPDNQVNKWQVFQATPYGFSIKIPQDYPQIGFKDTGFISSEVLLTTEYKTDKERLTITINNLKEEDIETIKDCNQNIVKNQKSLNTVKSSCVGMAEVLGDSLRLAQEFKIGECSVFLFTIKNQTKAYEKSTLKLIEMFPSYNKKLYFLLSFYYLDENEDMALEMINSIKCKL